MLVGLAFAFAVAALFAAVQTAGGLADIVVGLLLRATVDPINGNQGGAFAELYGLVGVTAMFIAIGGDAWMLRGLARTFTLVPLTKAPQITSLVDGAEQAFAQIFVGGDRGRRAGAAGAADHRRRLRDGLARRPAAQRLLGRASR